AVVCYVLTNHSDLVRQGVASAREQVAVAARNFSAATERSERPGGGLSTGDDSTKLHPSRVKALAAQMTELSHEQLWTVMNDRDFDRRAAASQVLLSRADIPASTQGIQVIKDRYFHSGRTDDLKIGFGY